MRWVELGVCCGLLSICHSSLLAQDASAVSSPQGHLFLRAMQAEEALRLTNRRYETAIAVAVSDAERLPIPGAVVEFTFPEKGANAILPKKGVACGEDGTGAAVPSVSSPASQIKVACVKTDADGIATLTGLRANNVPGPLSIRVRASFGGETTAVADIKERNQAPPFIGSHKKWIVTAACVAALVTSILLTRSSAPHATIGTVTATGPVGQ